MRLEEYFDKIILINLARRKDRLEESMVQFAKLGNPPFTLFEAHDMPGDGNRGCTASHRGVLELICHHGWRRTLILEDDFHVVHDDCQERFSAMIGDVPDAWSMIYLGGHYAENPQARISPHVLRMGHMKTTSSYAVTYGFARMAAPWIFNIGPIDELYREHNRNLPCYIFQPRLMVQREGYSDLQQHVTNNEPCMSDTFHEGQV